MPLDAADLRFMDKAVGGQLDGDREAHGLRELLRFIGRAREAAGSDGKAYRCEDGPGFLGGEPAGAALVQRFPAQLAGLRGVKVVEVRDRAQRPRPPLRIGGHLAQHLGGRFRKGVRRNLFAREL